MNGNWRGADEEDLMPIKDEESVKVIVLDGSPESMHELAEYLLAKALNDRDRGPVIKELIADCDVDRDCLFATAFAFGVSETISAMGQGKITPLNKGRVIRNNYESTNPT